MEVYVLKTQELLEMWADELSLPLEEIETLYAEIYDSLSSIKDKKLREKRARQKTYRRLKAKWTALQTLKEFHGFFIGESGLQDRYLIRKRWARKLIENGKREEAIERGLIDSTGTVLDPQGKPIENRHLWERNIYGFFYETGKRRWRFCNIRLSRDMAKKFVVPLFQPIKILMRERRAGEIYRMGLSKYSSLQPIEELMDFEQIIRNTCEVYGVDEIYQEWDSIRQYPNRLLWLEAQIDWISRPFKRGGRRLRLIPAEGSLAILPIVGFLPPYLRIDFGLGTIALLFGRLSLAEIRDASGVLRTEFQFNILGLYPLPGFIEPIEGEEEEEEEEKEEETEKEEGRSLIDY